MCATVLQRSIQNNSSPNAFGGSFAQIFCIAAKLSQAAPISALLPGIRSLNPALMPSF